MITLFTYGDVFFERYLSFDDKRNTSKGGEVIWVGKRDSICFFSSL